MQKQWLFAKVTLEQWRGSQSIVRVAFYSFWDINREQVLVNIYMKERNEQIVICFLFIFYYIVDMYFC